MKHIISNVIIKILLFSLFLSVNAFGQDNEKLAQTGFQFLTVGTYARSAALGEAFTTHDGTSIAMFHNPAGLSRMNTTTDINISQMTWIADINYYSGAAAVNIENFGVIGVSFNYVDYGEFIWTKVDPGSEKGYADINEGWGMPTSYVAGITYAKDLSDKFSVGGTIKYANQNLGNSYVPTGSTDASGALESKIEEYSKSVIAFDFGTIYKTGYKSFAFGMSIRNFAGEQKYESESFQLPLTFRIGVSMDLFNYFESINNSNKFTLSIDAVHPRSFPEYLAIGGEYVFQDILFLRMGYITTQSDYSYSIGAGVSYFGIGVNYSDTPFDTFNSVNRVSVAFLF